MIVADLKHLGHQVAMTPLLKQAIDFLLLRDLTGLPDGRVDIDGERVFAIVQCYETVRTDAPQFEYHKKYIDVQFVVSGREIIGWTPAERIAVTAPYEAEKDIAFGTVPQGEWSPVLVTAGQAAVFWPEDGHAPRLAADASSTVRKIVVKVAS